MPISSLELDPQTQARLDRVASSLQQTPAEVVRQALDQYLSSAEKRDQFRKDTLASWADYQSTGLHLTADEVDAWFDQIEAGDRVPLPECHT